MFLWNFYGFLLKIKVKGFLEIVYVISIVYMMYNYDIVLIVVFLLVCNYFLLVFNIVIMGFFGYFFKYSCVFDIYG